MEYLVKRKNLIVVAMCLINICGANCNSLTKGCIINI